VLPASARLTERQAFREVTRRGRRASRSGMVLYLLPPQARSPAENPPPKVGFIVGRQVGGATVRNRVRRRLRHLMAERRSPIPPGTAVVVRALPRSAGMTYGQLAIQLDECLASALAPRVPRRTGSQ